VSFFVVEYFYSIKTSCFAFKKPQILAK